MTQIEKIKAEIERQLFEISNYQDVLGLVRKEDLPRYTVLRELEDFIDSLEKDQEIIQITPPTFAPISTEPGKDGSIVKKDSYLPIIHYSNDDIPTIKD